MKTLPVRGMGIAVGLEARHLLVRCLRCGYSESQVTEDEYHPKGQAES